jgi:penicillin-binding protein 2
VGGIKLDKWYYPDWKQGGHGQTNVYKAIADSVNTFFYYIGGGYKEFSGLGLERILKYLDEFNFGTKLGIDLPGEKDGFLPSREWKDRIKGEPWYIGDTYHLSIGQGDFLTTPLQITNMTASIANGGVIYRPHIVESIKDFKNTEVEEIKPEIISDEFKNDENVEIIRKAMRQTVTSGSGVALNSLSFSSAGKTGTAQVGGDKDSHAWFTAFAPFEEPKIAITVLIENGGGGDVVAVPVVREVLRWYLNK